MFVPPDSLPSCSAIERGDGAELDHGLEAASLELR